MKKVLLVLFILLTPVLLIGGLNGCRNNNDGVTDKLRIVTTIFPEYDWVRAILGDQTDYAELTMLLDNGVDMHSYQPTADDMIRISTCDMFIYIGGESDAWVERALKEAVNKEMIVVNLLEALGDQAKEEEIVEGMEKETDEAEDTEYDEHIWLSLKNAEILCRVIADKLALVDPDRQAIYDANVTAYIEKLNALDVEYKAWADASESRTVLFADRFPFRYLVDDYGLTYYAAFAGCSSESEASFETIAFLAGKIDELNLSAVLTIEGTGHKLAETVVQTTLKKNARILSMDSMQSVNYNDIKSGTTYLSVMEKNLEVLKDALK